MSVQGQKDKCLVDWCALPSLEMSFAVCEGRQLDHTHARTPDTHNSICKQELPLHSHPARVLTHKPHAGLHNNLLPLQNIQAKTLNNRRYHDTLPV